MSDETPAIEILDAALAEHNPSHVFGLFSGGDDSLCSTHIASKHFQFDAAVHIDTGIGIQETRRFVDRTAERHGWELLVYEPDEKTYDDLVLEKGFPSGPKSHNTMYYWLKQRQVRRLVQDYKQHTHDRIGLVTGIRLSESDRRMGSTISVEVRREGAQLWIQPILYWTRRDLNNYIKYCGLERNEVTAHLHRSGECLCGALANPDEINLIDFFYPEDGQRIHDLEAKCEARGLVDCRWAAPSQAPGMTWHDLEEETGQSHLFPLCTDCELAHV